MPDRFEISPDIQGLLGEDRFEVSSDIQEEVEPSERFELSPDILEEQQSLAAFETTRAGREAFTLRPQELMDVFQPSIDINQEMIKDQLRTIADRENIKLEGEGRKPGVFPAILSGVGKALNIPLNLVVGLTENLRKRQEVTLELASQGKFMEAIGANVESIINMPGDIIRAVSANETFKDTQLYKDILDRLPKSDPVGQSAISQTLLKMTPGAIEFVGDVILDPLTFTTVGAKGVKAVATKGRRAGQELRLTDKGVDALKEYTDTYLDQLVKARGVSETKAKAILREDLTNKMGRAIAERTGQPIAFVERTLMEVVEQKQPHLIEAITRTGSRAIEDSFEFASKLTKEEINSVLTQGAPTKALSKELDKIMDIFVRVKKAKGEKISVGAVNLERKRLEASLLIQNAYGGGPKGLDKLAQGMRLRGPLFSEFEHILTKKPHLVDDLVDLGGISFGSNRIIETATINRILQPARDAVRESLEKIPYIGSGILQARDWAGKAFIFQFNVPKELRWLERNIWDNATRGPWKRFFHEAAIQFKRIAKNRKASKRIADSLEDEVALKFLKNEEGEVVKIVADTNKDGSIKILETSADKIANLPLEEQEIALFAKGAMNEMARNEVAVDLLDANQIIDSYVPHILDIPTEIKRKMTDDEWKTLANSVKSLVAKTGFEQHRTVPSIKILKAAHEAGLLKYAPIDEIERLFLIRGRHSINSIAQKKFEDAVVSKFAVKVGAKEGIRDIDNFKRFDFATQSALLPEPIANRLSQIKRDIIKRRVSEDEVVNPLLGMLDAYTNFHKFMLTVPFPSFTARNIANNVINNAMDMGVASFDPRLVAHSIFLQLGKRGDNIAKRFADSAVGRAIKFEGAEVATDLGDRIPYKQVREMFEDTGLAMSTFLGGEVRASSRATDKALKRIRQGTLRRRFGLWTDLVQGAETNAKVLSFVHKIKKGDAPLAAAEQVRKFLFDYTQLTQFEKTWLRGRFFPFYTFSRKNLALHLELLLEKPGIFSNSKRFFDLQRRELKNEEIPGHVRGMPFIKWTDAQGRNLIFSNFGIGYDDLIQLVNGDIDYITDKLASRTNFVFKTALELKTLYSFFNSRRIEKAKTADGLAEVIDEMPKEMRDFFGFNKTIREDGRLEVTMKPELQIVLRNLPTSRLWMSFVEPLLTTDLEEHADAVGLPEYHPLRLQARQQRVTKFWRIMSNFTPVKPEIVDPKRQERITWMNNIQKIEDKFVQDKVWRSFNIVSPRPLLKEEFFVEE